MKGQRAFGVFIACLALLLVLIVLELVGDVDVPGSLSDAIAGWFGVPAGSFAGWLAIVIAAGAIVLVGGGTVTLIKNALDLFKE